MFGLGLAEQLADEITRDLRNDREKALAKARRTQRLVKMTMRAKGINYGYIVTNTNGHVDTSSLEGIDDDLSLDYSWGGGHIA